MPRPTAGGRFLGGRRFSATPQVHSVDQGRLHSQPTRSRRLASLSLGFSSSRLPRPLRRHSACAQRRGRGNPVERLRHGGGGLQAEKAAGGHFQDSPIGEGTIDFITDGSIVGFQGRPGKMLSRPRLLRPPSFRSWRGAGPLSAAQASPRGPVPHPSPPQPETDWRAGHRRGPGRHQHRRRARVLPQRPPRLLSETWGMPARVSSTTRTAADIFTREGCLWEGSGRGIG